jgi:hypothetical protein
VQRKRKVVIKVIRFLHLIFNDVYFGTNILPASASLRRNPFIFGCYKVAFYTFYLKTVAVHFTNQTARGDIKKVRAVTAIL